MATVPRECFTDEEFGQLSKQLDAYSNPFNDLFIPAFDIALPKPDYEGLLDPDGEELPVIDPDMILKPEENTTRSKLMLYWQILDRIKKGIPLDSRHYNFIKNEPLADRLFEKAVTDRKVLSALYPLFTSYTAVSKATREKKKGEKEIEKRIISKNLRYQKRAN